MLEKQIRGFLQYYKVSGFRPRSLQALTIRLYDFSKVLKANRLSRIGDGMVECPGSIYS